MSRSREPALTTTARLLPGFHKPRLDLRIHGQQGQLVLQKKRTMEGHELRSEVALITSAETLSVASTPTYKIPYQKQAGNI